MTIGTRDDRTDLWLSLVRRLTEVSERWVIWKNADAAFAGHGDIDSAAPMEEWGIVVGEFRQWAGTQGLGPVIVCRHPPLTMFLLAVDPSRSELVELDVLSRKYFRGGTLFRAEDLPALARLDERGFRVLGPGAQGIILLLGNGLLWGGRPDQEAIGRRRIADLLTEDPEGAVAAGRRFGLPGVALQAAVSSVAEGRWDRKAMLSLERSALLRAAADPAILARRVRFRLWTKRRCPVLRSVFYEDRSIRGDLDAWLARVARRHQILSTEGLT